MSLFDTLTSELTDDELETALSELDECSKTGIISDGIVRNCAKHIKNITQQSSLDLITAQILIYKEISKRWQEMRDRDFFNYHEERLN